MRVSMCLRTALDVPPSGMIERPRRQRSSRVPSKCSTWKLHEKTASPNFVDSSHPKHSTRLHLANLKAAIASPASVTSPRMILFWRWQLAGASMSGVRMASTSWMLAETVDGATPRASCAHFSARSSSDSACHRPSSSRRGRLRTCCSGSHSLSLWSSGASCCRSRFSCLSSASAACRFVLSLMYSRRRLGLG